MKKNKTPIKFEQQYTKIKIPKFQNKTRITPTSPKILSAGSPVEVLVDNLSSANKYQT